MVLIAFIGISTGLLSLFNNTLSIAKVTYGVLWQEETERYVNWMALLLCLPEASDSKFGSDSLIFFVVIPSQNIKLDHNLSFYITCS